MKKPDKPTLKSAQMSFCKRCVGKWLDGKIDCQNPRREFYSWMPYAKMDPDLEWMEYNPKVAGDVKWEDCGRNLTDEQKEKLQENIKKAHEARRNKNND